MIPTVVLDAAPDPVAIYEGAGWVQRTPTGRGDRTYEVTAPWWTGTEPFTSMTSILGRGIPTDWTGPTKHNIATGTVANWDRLAVMDDQARKAEILGYADASLNAAADRGSAIHRAIEALLHGLTVDRHDLESNSALPYLLAVERFVSEVDPRAELIETVCFDPDNMTAGTVDFVGRFNNHPELGLVVADWKTRTKGHDRRQKEAAQVGGYSHCLGAHFYIDANGERRSVQVDGCVVVTFAPDGTYALHSVDRVEAVAHYQRACDMARANSVRSLYGAAVHSGIACVNTYATDRIAAIPDDAPEKRWLAQQWANRRLGRPSRGELTVEQWVEADRLLAEAEASHRPFGTSRITPPRQAATAEITVAISAVAELPTDLRDRIRRTNAPLLRRLDSGRVSADELDTLNAALAPATAEAIERLDAIAVHVDAMNQRYGSDVTDRILSHAPTVWSEWTQSDLDRVVMLDRAFHNMVLHVENGELLVTAQAIEMVAASGRRQQTAKAKQIADDLRRTRPSKWSDVCADPVLFAALCVA